jgi:hypothetical protein
MERIMSKTNEISNLEHHDTLADSELDAVTGGVKTAMGPDGITKRS